MSELSVRFMRQLPYIPAEMCFLETRLNIFWHCLNVIHFCLWLPSSNGRFKINSGASVDDACMCLNLYFASQRLFVRRPIYLSEHILGEMSEWYWQRPIGRRVHILFTLHTSCSFNSGKLLCLKKRLSLFCHSASQVTFTANNLTGQKEAVQRPGQNHQRNQGGDWPDTAGHR